MRSLKGGDVFDVCTGMASRQGVRPRPACVRPHISVTIPPYHFRFQVSVHFYFSSAKFVEPSIEERCVLQIAVFC